MAKAYLGIALLALAPTISTAGPSCAPHKDVVERLGSRYGETRQSIGLDANNAVIEIFASEKSGTWTITMTKASGVTCLVASGQAYEKLSENLPIDGESL